MGMSVFYISFENVIRKFVIPLCRAFALSALVIRINDPDGPPPYMNECGKQLGAN